MNEINVNPKPFVRWAGGKRRILNQIISLVPKSFKNYYEPFVGGGALFFGLNLHQKAAFLNDINPYLIYAYESIKDKQEFQFLLKNLPFFENNNSKDFYYSIRKKFNTIQDFNQKKLLFFYLNKVSFNGIYRENNKGNFNVPYNNNLSKSLFDYENLHKVYTYLNINEVNFFNGDFEKVLINVKPGDFVYFDPPYDSPSPPKSFTKYNSKDFSRNDQVRVKNKCYELSKKGVKVMISNHDTEFIRELYNDNYFNFTNLSVSRTINSNGLKRGKVKEVLIRNYHE